VEKDATQFSPVTRGRNKGELKKICVRCDARRKEKDQWVRQESLEDPKYLGDVIELLESHKSSATISLSYRVRVSSSIITQDLQAASDTLNTAPDDQQDTPVTPAMQQRACITHGKDKARRCADLIASRIWEALGYRFM